MSKKALLMILDGWGLGDQKKDDVIFNTPTPYWDYLMTTYPHSQLQASGENVGLPDGQMGNSEVGHLNIGAGLVVYQDLVKINRACADNSILKNPEVVSAFSYAKENGKSVHFMGLTSNGGVHSSLVHLFKLCDIAKEYNIDNTFIHCFMDGRDTDPKSGKGFIEELSAHCEKSAGKIASIIGRYYAMDRDKRWERVKEAYDLLVNGVGKKATDMVQAMQESYDEGVTDEFIKPIVNANCDGTIKEGDVVIFFNYRNDRAKELTVVFYFESTHFRLQVVSSHFGRRNKDTIFFVERSFTSTVEEECYVRIFFCFGDMKLAQAFGSKIFAQCVGYVFFVEQDMNALERCIIRSHTVILQPRNGMHASFRHILLSQYNSQLFGTVIPVFMKQSRKLLLL